MESPTKRWWSYLKTLFVWGIMGGVMVLVYAWLHTKGPAPDRATGDKERKIIPVTVEAPRLRPVQHSIHVVGTLYGYEEIPLTVKVDGRVIKVHHDVGDVVRPGDPLLDLDPTDYELAVREATRALELDLTRLQPGLLDVPGADFDVLGVPGVARAQAQEKGMRSRLDRATRLGAAISVEDRESAQRDYSVAAAELKQAIVEARATLASARLKKALLETAEQRLRETRLIVPLSLKDVGARPAIGSPVKGPLAAEFVVCQRGISEGEMARVLPIGTVVLFKLAMVHPLKLKATVPERHRGQVHLGQKCQVRIEAYPGEEFLGTVTRINPAIDKTSRTFDAEIQVPNEDRRISPGAFARASILTRVDPAAVMVPEEALLRFAGVTKLFVAEGEKAREIQVKTGANLEDPGPPPRQWVEVLGALPENAQVITSGQTNLADGSPIRLRTP